MTKDEANTIKFTEKRLKRLAKWILGSLLVAVLLYLAVGYAVYHHMERHGEAIRKGMSINEVRHLGRHFCRNSLRTKDYHEALKKVAELVPITQARTAEEERQKLIQHTQITLLREVTPAVVAEYAAYLRRQPLSI